MLLCSTVLILLTLVDSGCSEPSTKFTPPPAQPDEPKSVAPAEPVAPGDQSLTSEEYIRLGMPAQDRDWSGDDMLQAAKVLKSLTWKGYGQLPRYGSERSGEMFARLTSPRSFEMFRARALPIEVRLSQSGVYYQGFNQINQLYLAGFLKHAMRGSESVELTGVGLRMTVVMFEVIEEFVPTLAKGDPTYQFRMESLAKLPRLNAVQVNSCLVTLTEREFYQKSDLVRLLDYMQETFPLIVPRLPPGSRAETLLRLDKLQDDPALKDLQPGLGELRSKVKAAMEKDAP